MLRIFSRRRRDLLCMQFVEVVTDYLEGAMDAPQRAAFERHLRACHGCTRYLAQIRTTIELVGRLTEDDIDALGPHARDELLTAFRDYRAGGFGDDLQRLFDGVVVPFIDRIDQVVTFDIVSGTVQFNLVF